MYCIYHLKTIEYYRPPYNRISIESLYINCLPNLTELNDFTLLVIIRSFKVFVIIKLSYLIVHLANATLVLIDCFQSSGFCDLNFEFHVPRIDNSFLKIILTKSFEKVNDPVIFPIQRILPPCIASDIVCLNATGLPVASITFWNEYLLERLDH